MNLLDEIKSIDRYDIVHVVWEDIVSDNSWLSESEIEEITTAVIDSVGWFLSSNDAVIKISDTYDFKESSGSMIVIPIGCIQKISVWEN